MNKTELTGRPFSGRDEIKYAAGSIVSREILKNSAGNITLFAFDQDQQLSEHTAPFDAVIQIVDGEAQIRIAEQTYEVSAGEMIIMPANVPHAVYAKSRFKMILTMIKGN